MPSGLSSPSAYRVAKYLDDHPDSVITAMADALGLSRSTVTKALAALEAAGQVERRRGVRAGNRVEPDTWRVSTVPPDDGTVDPADNSNSDSEPIAPVPTAVEPHETNEAEPRSIDEPAEPVDVPQAALAPGVAAPAIRDSSTGSTKQRLRPGELREAVLAYFTEHTEIEVTAGDVARVLGRSAGAVHNVLQKVVTEGSVALTSNTPRRYKAVPPK